jgi:hypothetical protein
VVSGKQRPPCAGWTEDEGEWLVASLGDMIDIGDTAYRQELVLRQSEFKAAVEKMSQEKRDKLRWKFNEFDVEEALVALAEKSTSSQEVSGVV